MSSKWVTTFDSTKCTGCCNCVLATLDEHIDNRYEGYSDATPLHGEKLLDIVCHERGAHPTVEVTYAFNGCRHCENPPCAAVAPDAVHVRQDGIVLIDPRKAKGRRDLVDACPFGAITWNAELELPQNWTMDAHLLDRGWKESRASQACPTGALVTQKVSEREYRSMRASQNPIMNQSDTKVATHVMTNGAFDYNTVALSGRVVGLISGHLQCIAGANVKLIDATEREIYQTQTDAFGIFKFDGLPPSPAKVRVTIDWAGSPTVTLSTLLDISKFLGEINLS